MGGAVACPRNLAPARGGVTLPFGRLHNEFIAARTNHRGDEWGGSYAHRMRFPVEIVRRTRERIGRNFIIIYRLSMLDLVEGGSTLEEVIEPAKAVEAAGATILNTGIGWHESCLDHPFGGKITSCLLNPRTCHETELVIEPARTRKRIAVVGAGPRVSSSRSRPRSAATT